MTTAVGDRPLGRLIFPALRWRAEGGFAHEAGAIDEALEVGVGGFIIFGGIARAVAALTADLVRRAERPLLIAADLERGAGQQFEGLTQFPPPLALASLDDPAVVRWAAATTAREARAVGVNWIFAPVADLDVLEQNPIIQTRAFGAEPAAVSRAVAAWVDGCQTAGALACAKHYPGHGRTSADSHVALPEVTADRATLEATDAVPFAAALDAGVASIMTAHVAYPALDPSGAPATLSADILGRLRREHGFDGLVVTDALIMDGALIGRSEAEAAVAALAAGVDILLYPRDPRQVLSALAAAVGDRTLPGARVDEALRRYDRALAQATLPATEGHGNRFPSAAALADALLEQPLLRGPARRLVGPLDLVIVDDDQDGPYPPAPSDYVRDTLRSAGIALGSGGSRVLLVLAEPRAWKGRAGLSSAHRAEVAARAEGCALVVLFGHPRLAREIPEGVPVLLGWHRQRLMQEAVGRWLIRRMA